MQAVGKLAEGTAYLDQGKANRRIAERNALYAQRDATAEESRVRAEARAAIGGQLAAQGAGGFQMGTGSALELLKESQTNAMLDVLTARRKGRTEGDALRYQGAMAQAEGQARATASYFGAAKSITDMAKDYAGAGS